MIPGTNITIGDRKFLVPPLNFAALKKHRPFLTRAMKGVNNPDDMGEEDFEIMLDIVYLAVKRNYPDITVAELEERVDMANIMVIFPALMKTSGFEEAETGAEK